MHQFQQEPQVQSTAVGNRLVLFHRRTQTTAILNPSGSRLWQMLAAPCLAAELAAALCSDHNDLESERAEADVSAFLASLQQQGLVRRHG